MASTWSWVTQSAARLRSRISVRNQAPGLVAQFRIEVGERLVGADHGRLVDEGAGDRDALLFRAARELVGKALPEMAQAEATQGFVHPPIDLGCRPPAQSKGIGNVFEDRLMRP